MNERRIKIALLIPSLHPGGMERVMSELANYFSMKNEIEVYLVLYGKSPQIFYQLNSKIIIYITNSSFNDKYRIYESLKRLFYIRKKIRKIKPDAILSFGTKWNSFVLLSLYCTSYRIFVSDRGSPVRKYKFSTEFFKIVLYPKAAGIISQTITAYNISKKRFPKSEIRVIGNPIRLLKSYNEEPRENIILSVGRLISSKHHDRLIKIFSKINAPDWKLVIVGGNALNEDNFDKLKYLIEDLDLKDKIILAGEQKDVEKYFHQSKVFAFTSSSEGFPNVIGEALSEGLPVVSYDCIAGPSEMITDGENGFLVPVFEDDQFEKKLQLLIDNEPLRKRMGTNAIESIKRFSVDSIGQQFLDFITP
jgi:GalNAc-alpha-(1->4)-GalNAc-alpha-(1->3)-diNAcBac-PP-undecaprenol alpha-1,4-N-acetyl-D-galactosaminyltransferase